MRDFPHTLKIVTVWGLLGLLVFLGLQAWQLRQQRTLFTTSPAGEIEIRRAADGHYHWPGRVNGIEVEFLVDTGATSTALPQALAARAALRAEGSITSSTAAGTVQGVRARADIELDGGVHAQGLLVTVLPGLAAPLLGMDMLAQLHFSQRDGVLRFAPRPAGS